MWRPAQLSPDLNTDAMHLLIDGYNLMHAVVLPPGRRLAKGQLRQLRLRFLNDLSALLGSELTSETTIVFDASHGPSHLPRESRHLGMQIIFAEPDQDADERIELLIAEHSSPKQLLVVSTDHRVRLAAKRRRAEVETSDTFWSRLEDRAAKARTARKRSFQPPPSPIEPRDQGLNETAHWMAEFGHLDEASDLKEAARPADFVPSDEDLARIAREVDEESRWN